MPHGSGLEQDGGYGAGIRIEESKIIEIRNEHVYDEATRSVQKHGWLPDCSGVSSKRPTKSYRY